MPTHLIVGPESHGVTRYALELAAATDAPVLRESEFSAVALPDSVDSVHVAFTDHLFGDSPPAAVDALLARVGSRQLSVSFHDIPQPEEGADRFARRAPAYQRLAAAADVAVVNSEHEARFFRDTRIDVDVIRLPIPLVESVFDPEPATVGILGFLYPGKGHEELIEALRGTNYRLRFLGSVSPGHEEWARGLDGEITGWLPEEDLAAEMGRIQIPVCAHRHFSASGSLMTWLGAGRHVLASDTDYTREIDEWLPNRITRVQPDSWRSAIDAYAATPSPQMTAPEYGWADVAAQWRKAWA